MKIHSTNYYRHKNSGIALVMALLVLLVMTIFGVTMLGSAGMQERMAGNQKRITDSSMAAEAGLQAHLAWLAADPENNWDSQSWPNGIQDMESYGYTVSAGDSPLARHFTDGWWSFSSIDSDPLTPQLPCGLADDTCVVEVTGQAVGGSDSLAQTRIEAIVQYFPGEIPLGGDKDIWTQGNVRISGNAYLTNTYLHSNGEVSEVTITGGRTTLDQSRITANGEASVNLDIDDQERCVDCSIIDQAGLPLPPPDFATRIRDLWLPEVSASNTVTFTSFDQQTGNFLAPGDDPNSRTVAVTDFYGNSTPVDCSSNAAPTFTLTDSDLGSNRIIFVNGHTTLSSSGGAFENLTIISTCDMVHNGSMRQGGSGGEVNNVFYAAGDMTFNGSTGGNSPATVFQGRYFAGGGMTQNGNAEISGQIVLLGDLVLNGVFRFTGANSLGGNSDNQEGDGSVRLVNWRQIW